MEVLSSAEGPLSAAAPIGVTLHLTDLFADELLLAAGIAPLMSAVSAELLLAPFVTLLASCSNDAVVARTRERVFEAVLRAFRERLPMLAPAKLADALFAQAASEQSTARHRKMLYQLHRQWAEAARQPPADHAAPQLDADAPAPTKKQKARGAAPSSASAPAADAEEAAATAAEEAPAQPIRSKKQKKGRAAEPAEPEHTAAPEKTNGTHEADGEQDQQQQQKKKKKRKHKTKSAEQPGTATPPTTTATSSSISAAADEPDAAPVLSTPPAKKVKKHTEAAEERAAAASATSTGTGTGTGTSSSKKRPPTPFKQLVLSPSNEDGRIELRHTTQSPKSAPAAVVASPAALPKEVCL